MSLLEDVFLQDEAGEAQELERIIEGDEYDERPRDVDNSDDNSEKEDEAEEDKRRVDPASTKTKRIIKNPRCVLNPARLTGPRGIQVIPEHFKDFRFKGKGNEREDLDLVLKKLEHWAYRLYPKFQFEDCLKKIETLGKKRPVVVHLHKIRSDQLQTEETVVQKDSSDEEPAPEEDEFDKLLQQQIELARTPGPVTKPALSTPLVDKRSSLIMPKATSSPSISDEQKERMLRNKRLAEERRLAKLKAVTESTQNCNNDNPTVDLTGDHSNGNMPLNANDTNINEDTAIEDQNRPKKKRQNVVDSSDDEDALVINENAEIDIHESVDLNNKAVNDRDTVNIDLTNGPVNGRDISELIVVNDDSSKARKKRYLVDISDEDSSVDNQATNISVDLTNIDELQPNLNSNHTIDIDTEDEEILTDHKKHNRSNAIDSSDDECDVTTVKESVVVDVHNVKNVDDDVMMDKASVNESLTKNNHDDIQFIESEFAVNDDFTELLPQIENGDKDSDIALKKLENIINSDTTTKDILIDNIPENDDDTKDKGKYEEKDSLGGKETPSNTSKEDETAIEELMDVDFSDDF